MFMYFFKLQVFCALILFCNVILPGANIIENQKSEYSIFLAPKAIEAERTAAMELQKYLEKSTGVKLPITNEYSGNKQILVGNSQMAANLLPEINFKNFKQDEILIAPAKNNLILAGDTPRGTLYSVYEFLERDLGIRFFTAGDELIPTHKILILPEKSYRYAPEIAIRGLSFGEYIHNPEFAVKSRQAGPLFNLPEAWGGKVDLIGPWHTFERFIPESKYFAAHPEWFSLVNGKRVAGQLRGQLCLSNPELRQEFLKNFLAELRNHPRPKFISASQNDNMFFCQCPECAKVDAINGSPSGSIIEFVNFIAGNVKKEFPDVIVQTFAYQYSRHAPKQVKPLDNVAIFYCTIEHDLVTSLASKQNKINAEIYKDLQEWAKISRQIDIWDYVTSFSTYLLPLPNLDSTSADIKTFAENKPHMVMLQGDILNRGTPGDLQALKSWVWSKLLWNPQLDPRQLEQEFVENYYGSAASEIKKYLEFRRNAIKNARPMNCFTFSSPWLKPATALQGLEILKAAKQLVADNPALMRKIEIAAKPLEFWILDNFNSVSKLKNAPNEEQLREIAKNYLRFMDTEKVIRWGEEWGSETSINGVRTMLKYMSEGYGLKLRLPEFFNTLKGKSYFIIEENAFVFPGGAHFAEIVKDEKAANGLAIALYHKEFSWSPQLYFKAPMNIEDTFDIYAAIRLDTPGQAGLFEFSGWDGKAVYFSSHIDADKANTSEYAYVKLATSKIKNTGYFYLGGKVNPAIKRTLIDHLVFVKK